jgi:phosphonate transport system substrate-binding protein
VAWNVREQSTREVRFVTYLAPSIPRALFEALADHLQRSLIRERVSLRIETRVSGPRKGHECYSFGDRVDVAFMCAPSFVWLRGLKPPTAELLGVAPVFDVKRAAGRPVYFCDVVVRTDAPFHTFYDLEGSSWAYNDPSSLSGYYGPLHKLAEAGKDESFFGSVSCSGSHLNSIDAILRGEVDAAAIDSNVLRIQLQETPALSHKLRLIQSWGPFPIQPVVISSRLHPDLKDQLRAAFLTANEDERTHQVLQRFGLSHFVTVDHQAYNLEAHKDLAKLLTRPPTRNSRKPPQAAS